MYNLEKIGEIVRQLRLSGKKYTQESFAELIDVSTETVSNIERGLVFLNTKTLLNISEKCHVSTDYILGNESGASCDDILAKFSPELIEKWENRLKNEDVTKEEFLKYVIKRYIETGK